MTKSPHPSLETTSASKDQEPSPWRSAWYHATDPEGPRTSNATLEGWTEKPDMLMERRVPSKSAETPTPSVLGVPYHQFISTAPLMPGTLPEAVYCQALYSPS